nr:hypothetical protein Iba_chr03cCG7040 [Ipomoea batatas]
MTEKMGGMRRYAMNNAPPVPTMSVGSADKMDSTVVEAIGLAPSITLEVLKTSISDMNNIIALMIRKRDMDVLKTSISDMNNIIALMIRKRDMDVRLLNELQQKMIAERSLDQLQMQDADESSPDEGDMD